MKGSLIMKAIKHFTLTALALLTAICLSACESVDKKPVSSANSQTAGENSSEYPINEGKFSASIKEPEDIPESCNIYALNQKRFSEQDILKLFSEVPQKTDNSTDTELFLYDTDNEHGQLNDGNLLFETKKAQNLLDTAYSSLLLNDNAEQFISADNELDFASRDEVMETVKTELYDKFGIAPEKWYAFTFNAVSKEGVDHFKQEVNRVANEDTTDSFDHQKDIERAERVNAYESEDFYYISIKFRIDDIPLYTGVIFNYGNDPGNVIFGSDCYIIYTENGIELLSCYRMKEISSSQGNETIIEADKAKELITQKYDSIIVDGNINVYDMQLVYLPLPKNDLGTRYSTFEARPYYAFYCTQTVNVEGTVIEQNIITYFDAVTGKEFGTERH